MFLEKFGVLRHAGSTPVIVWQRTFSNRAGSLYCIAAYYSLENTNGMFKV